MAREPLPQLGPTRRGPARRGDRAVRRRLRHPRRTWRSRPGDCRGTRARARPAGRGRAVAHVAGPNGGAGLGLRDLRRRPRQDRARHQPPDAVRGRRSARGRRRRLVHDAAQAESIGMRPHAGHGRATAGTGGDDGGRARPGTRTVGRRVAGRVARHRGGAAGDGRGAGGAARRRRGAHRRSRSDARESRCHAELDLRRAGDDARGAEPGPGARPPPARGRARPAAVAAAAARRRGAGRSGARAGAVGRGPAHARRPARLSRRGRILRQRLLAAADGSPADPR